MSRLVFFSVIILIAVVGLFVVILSVPEKPLACKSGDNLCPAGCTFEIDKDCLRSRTTTLGEVRHCLTSTDCAIVEPFCGNPACAFTDYECKTDKFCATAIGKDYLAAWQTGKAKCLAPIETECTSLDSFEAKCVLGECRVIGKK